MPKISTQHITHSIGGGWATDFGPTYYGAPDGTHIRLPWLTQAENLIYTLDGGAEKWRGTQPFVPDPIKDPVLGSTHIKAIIDYWKGASSQKTVAAIGSSFFDITASGASLIGSTNSSVATDKIHFSVFNDLLIIGVEGGSSPRSWDQTTYQTLAGTPPAFGFSTYHRGRHWAAGYNNNPSRLYYSVVGSPEDWVGSGSGSIDIDPGDGDEIVGMASWKNELFVFKGPNQLSIHRITGSVTADFERKPFVYGISAASQTAIFEYGNDIGFWSPRGSCHSLAATDTYGDYAQALINYPILSWCLNNTNIDTTGAPYWQALTNTTENYSIFNFTKYPSSFGINNSVILMDWKFLNQGEQYPRFSRLTYTPFSSVALYLSGSSVYPLWGSRDGVVYQTRPITSPHRATSNFTHGTVDIERYVVPFRLQTPSLTYGSTNHTKSVSDLTLNLSTAHRSTVTVKWGGPNQLKQTTTVDQPGYTPLGSFVLGTDCLGELGDAPVFCQELNGDFQAIQYNIIEDSDGGDASLAEGAGIKLLSFGATVTMNSDSTEN